MSGLADTGEGVAQRAHVVDVVAVIHLQIDTVPTHGDRCGVGVVRGRAVIVCLGPWRDAVNENVAERRINETAVLPRAIPHAISGVPGVRAQRTLLDADSVDLPPATVLPRAGHLELVQ